MVDFSYETINQIKEATDDGHVKIIIEDSIKMFSVKKRRGFSSKRRFMMNKTMSICIRRIVRYNRICVVLD